MNLFWLRRRCATESPSPSPFYELDLSLGGRSQVTLAESLAEFLKEERLEGSDQYSCSFCRTKQNATRSIRLRRLPPVLNIQLLRFVFDRSVRLLAPFVFQVFKVGLD